MEPNSASAGPLWFTLSPDYSGVEFLGCFSLKPRHEMYYAQQSEIGGLTLIIRYGKGDNDRHITFVNEASHDDPEIDEVFKTAYGCARRKGYIV